MGKIPDPQKVFICSHMRGRSKAARVHATIIKNGMFKRYCVFLASLDNFLNSVPDPWAYEIEFTDHETNTHKCLDGQAFRSLYLKERTHEPTREATREQQEQQP